MVYSSIQDKKGRGMELSDLVKISGDGNYLCWDDRNTEMVYNTVFL